MQAVLDYVIVTPVYQEKSGNIILPGVSKIPGVSEFGFGKFKQSGEFQLYHGFIYGIVVAVGPYYPSRDIYANLLKKYGEPEARSRIERYLRPKIGDKIIFTRHEGVKFTYEKVVYLKLKAQWVLAIINV